MEFRVDQIDHVEVTVPDRLAAAEWYGRVLGLEILGEYQDWAENPNGPLMIETKHAGTKIALFRGDPTGSQQGVGFHRLAFRVSGAAFLSFVSSLETLRITNRNKKFATKNDVKDHKRAFSIYFCDPWGNALEITTYDAKIVREGFRADSDDAVR